MSTIETNLVQPSTGTTLTLGAASDVIQIPASAEIDIASGATLDVNGTIDLTGATKTGFPTSGLNLITSQTNNSAVASWNFGDCFSATYRVYLVQITGLVHVTGSQETRLKIGVSNLSTVESFGWAIQESNAIDNRYQSVGDTLAYMDLDINVGGEPMSCNLYIYNPFDSAQYTQVVGQSVYYHTGIGGNSQGQATVGGMATAAASSASMQLQCSSGNLGSASYTARVSIYGLGES